MSTETVQPTARADAKEHLGEVLQAAERHLRYMFDQYSNEQAFGHHMGAYLGWASHAYFLDAFLKADPAAAQAAFVEFQEMADAGEAVGEWLWSELEARGVDPDKLEPLACCTPPAAGAEVPR